MSPKEREKTFEALTKAVLQPGEVPAWLKSLQDLESRYEMSTDEMLRRWKAGLIEDTADTSRWMILASCRPKSKSEPEP